MLCAPFTLLTVMFLVGCESADRITATDFKPVAGGFNFRAPAGPQYPVDTPAGEASRMKMLDEWLTSNKVCPNGYVISSRQPVQRTPFVHDVFYEGRCKAQTS